MKGLPDIRRRSKVRVLHLHGGVVQRYEGGEQVQVTSGEHQGKQDLTLPRNTYEETAEDTQNIIMFASNIVLSIWTGLQFSE